MTTGDAYRSKAAELMNRARREPLELLRAEYERLAQYNLRLAEQADQAAITDRVQPEMQQQQRQPPEKKEP